VTSLPAAGLSRFGDEHRPWLAGLESVGRPPRELPLPERDELPAIFVRLVIAPADAAEIVAAWPSPGRDAELWWVLERAYHTIVRDMGGFEYVPWPALPPAFGETGRFFYAYVFLAALGDVREFHARRGIPDDVSWASLADLGRNLRRDRLLFGEGGLRTHEWLTLHFRGALYELGRLQFNRRAPSRVRFPPESRDESSEGEGAVGIHIPESGPLSPAACDESLRRAREFFRRHFDETPVRIGICRSWLLDHQLAEYLDADSNIVRFQRRFHVVPGGSDGDADILRFVFKRIDPGLDELPQRTDLERAIVAHLRAGRHWQNRLGWLEL
jgi:hypothetical protein